MIIYLGQDADLLMAQLMPLLLTISCSSKSRLLYLPGFISVVPAYPSSPEQNPESCKMVVVIVVVLLFWYWLIQVVPDKWSFNRCSLN